MGKITILPETTRNPITLMGMRAGCCWNANTSDDKKNYKRGLDCIKSGHGRVMEYVNVEMIIDGYSARTIREWYTHVIGATKLQASTRYINYESFDYVTPSSIKNNKEALSAYDNIMNVIRFGLIELESFGIPREDIAMALPLGMTTKIVDKRNLRSLVDMSRVRMCNRAYHEYRQMFNDICNALREYSDEWKWIVDNLFHAKCDEVGYCTETKSCGKRPKLEHINSDSLNIQ